MEIQRQNRFLLVQHLTLLVNRYEYFSYENDQKGERIAFAEQKRFAFREAVTIWEDESRISSLFTVRAEKILDAHGKFLVEDADHNLIGYCKKSFRSSLIRSTWEVYDAKDVLLCTVREKSLPLAIARRLMGFIPFADIIEPFVPFNFEFSAEEKNVGSHHRIWGNFRDTYLLELGEQLQDADRRTFLALGILLDALQER